MKKLKITPKELCELHEITYLTCDEDGRTDAWDSPPKIYADIWTNAGQGQSGPQLDNLEKLYDVQWESEDWKERIYPKPKKDWGRPYLALPKVRAWKDGVSEGELGYLIAVDKTPTNYPYLVCRADEDGNERPASKWFARVEEVS